MAESEPDPGFSPGGKAMQNEEQSSTERVSTDCVFDNQIGQKPAERQSVEPTKQQESAVARTPIEVWNHVLVFIEDNADQRSMTLLRKDIRVQARKDVFQRLIIRPGANDDRYPEETFYPVEFLPQGVNPYQFRQRLHRFLRDSEVGDNSDVKVGDTKDVGMYDSLSRLLFKRSNLRHIELRAPFHKVLSQRCPHTRYPSDDQTDARISTSWRSPFLGQHMDIDLIPLLANIEEGQLRTFKFDIGTCTPHDLLGPTGYLTLHQRKIEDLSIITDPECWMAYGYPKNVQVSLSQFRRLKRLSWKGVRSGRDMFFIKHAMLVNRKHLEELTVEVGPYEAFETGQVFSSLPQLRWLSTLNKLDGYLSRGLHENPVLQNFNNGDTSTGFKVLQTLNLANFHIVWNEARFLLAGVTWGTLKHLSLRDCEFTKRVMDLVCRAYPLKSLEHLELVDVDLRKADSFVKGCLNLREYYLMAELFPTEACWQNLNSLGHSLRRLIFHSRHMHLDYMSGYLDNPFGNYFSDEDNPPPFNKMLQEGSAEKRPWIWHMKIECLGLCIEPDRMVNLS